MAHEEPLCAAKAWQQLAGNYRSQAVAWQTHIWHHGGESALRSARAWQHHLVSNCIIEGGLAKEKTSKASSGAATLAQQKAALITYCACS